MLTELEKQKRAVQATLKALKPNSGIVIKYPVKRKFEALNKHFNNYKNAYFGRELVDKELTSANKIFKDFTEKFY